MMELYNFILLSMALFVIGSYFIIYQLEVNIEKRRTDLLDHKYSVKQKDIKFMEIISDLQNQVKELKLTEAEKKTLKKAEKIKEKL